MGMVMSLALLALALLALLHDDVHPAAELEKLMARALDLGGEAVKLCFHGVLP
jgi:hypothetical protein